MAITAGGIGSGLDIGGLVSQLVAAEGQPAIFRLDTKEAGLQADLSAYGSLKSALSTFQDTVSSLNSLTSLQPRKSTSSNNDLFIGVADTTAVAGVYDIEVSQLAQAAKLRSGDGEFTDATDVVGTGTLDITLGAEAFQITITDANKTLEGIRDAINDATDNPGITASILNVDGGTQLIFSSDKVGSTNTIDIVATETVPNDGSGLALLATASLDVIDSAQDAIILVDAQTVTRDSNSFSDVIAGVTFNLQKAEPATVETLTIELDTTAVKSKVGSFVSAYNSLTSLMNSFAAFDADSGVAGALQGDSALRSIQNQLSKTLTDAVSGLDFGTLAEIGVTTDDTGNLVVDSDDLDSVLSTDFTAVSQLFASENGLADALDTLLEGYTSSDGILNARTDGIQTSIDSIGDDRERLDRRLLALEARFTRQFSAMDALVGELQALNGFLTQQLANLPRPNSINRNN